jgi:ubiquinone/menaquinone biosynthesis C-methylase UbiE
VSLEQLERHLAIWRSKPELRRVYEVWFDLLLAQLPRGAIVVEVGAGMGTFAPHARARRPDLRWIATELAVTGWNDIVADALRLPLRNGSVDAVVGIDVLHHLARPRWFFTEAARVLRAGGRVALVEPWVSALSFVIYRYFHQESCAFTDPWQPFAESGDTSKAAFDGNAAVLPLVVRRADGEEWRKMGLTPPRVELLNGLAYILTLGFRTSSLLPAAAAPALLRVDRWLQPLAPAVAMRALAVWTREGPPDDALLDQLASPDR